MKKRRVIFLLSLIVTALFYSLVFASEIEIRPVLKDKAYYIMKLGEVQTFEAYGFGWDNKVAQKIPDAKIDTIQWNFDSRFLQLVEEKGNFITLKAIKDRTSKLSVTGTVNGKRVTKTIFVVIKKVKNRC